MNASEVLRARLRAIASAEQERREPEAAKPADAAQAADAAPAAAPPSTDGDLWEAPRPLVEEPISQFLVEVPAEPLRPHERFVLPPVLPKVGAAPLPKAIAVSLPPVVEPPDDLITLDAHSRAVLQLLTEGRHHAALAALATPTQTRPAPSTDVTARWQCTRELAHVANVLPQRVVSILAAAIGRDHVSSARSELVEFRTANPDAAINADTLLRTRAKSIQRLISGALYVEPKVDLYSEPVSYASSSGPSPARFAWVFVVIALAIVRIVIRTNTPSYNYTPPSYTYSPDYSQQLLDLRAAVAEAEAARPVPVESLLSPPVTDDEEPAAYDRKAPTETLIDELDRSFLVLRENDWLSDAQRDVLATLWHSYYEGDDENGVHQFACTEVRQQLAALAKLKVPRGAKAALANRHLKGIRVRMDRLCPKTKAK